MNDPQVHGSRMLRITTAGDVDDGKSTLIGRLLFECDAIYDDLLKKIEQRGTVRGIPDLSLVADGLKSEREQGITIDVAYKYFATARRKFILADAPGHLQYTRNMVTAASTADAAILLVDATHGIVEQTRRHAYILSLLQIPRILLVINKIDLIAYDQSRVHQIEREFRSLPWYQENPAADSALTPPQIQVVPVSALCGDNVVTKSPNTPWYDGQSLLDILDRLDPPTMREINGAPPTKATASGLPFLNIQLILRAPSGERLATGTLQGGSLSCGDQVKIWPSGITAHIKSLYVSGQLSAQAAAGQAVAVSLDRPMDLERGFVLAHGDQSVTPSQRMAVDLVWFDDTPAVLHKKYLLRLGTQSVKASIAKCHHRVDLTTLDLVSAEGMHGNDIGHADLDLASPIYLVQREGAANRRFILVDLDTGRTAGAGIVQRLLDSPSASSPDTSPTDLESGSSVGRDVVLPPSLWQQNPKHTMDLLLRDLKELGWTVHIG